MRLTTAYVVEQRLLSVLMTVQQTSVGRPTDTNISSGCMVKKICAPTCALQARGPLCSPSYIRSAASLSGHLTAFDSTCTWLQPHHVLQGLALRQECKLACYNSDIMCRAVQLHG